MPHERSRTFCGVPHERAHESVTETLTRDPDDRLRDAGVLVGQQLDTGPTAAPLACPLLTSLCLHFGILGLTHTGRGGSRGGEGERL